MIIFILRFIVIEHLSDGGFPLEEASELCFLSIRVLFWCCGFIYCVVPLLFYAMFLFSAIIIALVPNIVDMILQVGLALLAIHSPQSTSQNLGSTPQQIPILKFFLSPQPTQPKEWDPPSLHTVPQAFPLPFKAPM
jgi:hypothetical protein